MSWWWWSFLDTNAGQLLDNAAVFTAFCPAADFPRPSNRTPSPIRRGSSIRTEPASLLPVHRGPGRQEGVPESLVLWCAEVESGGTTTPNAARGDDGVADGAPPGWRCRAPGPDPRRSGNHWAWRSRRRARALWARDGRANRTVPEPAGMCILWVLDRCSLTIARRLMTLPEHRAARRSAPLRGARRREA
jgi:hypothetical protein